MSAIRYVVALTSGRTPCSRCEHCHAVTGGEWHAVEPALPHLPICNACAWFDDPDVYAAVLSWRRTKEAT